MSKRISVALVAASLFVSACSGALSSPPDNQKIKADLLGSRIGNGITTSWKFDSLSEYEKFEIVAQQRSGDVAEYTVNTLLDSVSNDDRYTATLKIIYRRENGTWRLVSVSDFNSLTRIN